MLIDQWDVSSLPGEARELLLGSDGVLREYAAEEDRIDASKPKFGWMGIRPDNGALPAKEELEVKLAELVTTHEVRGFHYTRMTDAEVDALKKTGIVPTSPDFLEERLGRLVANGEVTKKLAQEILVGSALRLEGRYPYRNGLFWASALPLALDDRGVVDFHTYWGGEGAYHTVTDDAAKDVLRNIGTPRILELSVPIVAANDGRGPSSLAGRLVDLRRAQLGLLDKPTATDLTVRDALPPDILLEVHSHGEQAFEAFGKGYPANFGGNCFRQ